jgi:hypothetical protein
MMISTGSVSEEHSQYIGQIYQEHYPRLRHYFLMQLGDASEADECIHETIRLFFFFMEERQWEEEKAEYISVYLMRIAGLLCSRKLIEKRSQRIVSFDDQNNSLSNKIRTEVTEIIKKHIDFIRLVLRSVESNSRQPSGVR